MCFSYEIDRLVHVKWQRSFRFLDKYVELCYSTVIDSLSACELFKCTGWNTNENNLNTNKYSCQAKQTPTHTNTHKEECI